MLAYCVKLWPVVLHFKSRLVCFQLNFLLLHLERLPVLVQALAALRVTQMQFWLLAWTWPSPSH